MNHIEFNGEKFSLNHPINISIPMHKGFGQVNAFHAPPFRVTPVKEGDFIGAVKLGGPVNFMNVQVNPHGNGTHTECVGHISQEDYYVNDCLKSYFHLAEYIKIYPALEENGDKVIHRKHIEMMYAGSRLVNALIIATLPNETDKMSRNYSGSNPTYIHPEAMEYIVELGIEHLLVDFPSVDREEDGGKLAAHRIFWNYPSNPRLHCTITELIYVPEEVKEGSYLLQIAIPNISLDAVPSRIWLYKKED